MIGVIGIFILNSSSLSYITLLEFHLIFGLELYKNFFYAVFIYHYLLVVESPYTGCLFYRFLEHGNCHNISQWMQALYNTIVHVQWNENFTCVFLYVNYVLLTPSCCPMGRNSKQFCVSFFETIQFNLIKWAVF